MDAQEQKPPTSEVCVRQGDIIKFPRTGHSEQEVSCDDIARLALSIDEHSYFFSQRRNISTRFSRDLNGSGTQGLYIARERNNVTDTENLIRVFFNYTSKEDANFLYEANLFKDQGKDYEPTINHGMHRFVAELACIRIDWNCDEIQQWQSDIKRLSKSPDTLAGWIDNELEMLVRCSSKSCWREPVILNASDLKQHISAGLTLAELTARLKCSKCGTRGARIMVF